MPEPFTLTTLLIAGATMVGTETVKEATKDAYRKLKDKVGQVFGPRAATAVAKLEDPATHEEGGKELDRYVGDELRPDEATQIQPFVEALVHALQDDTVAKTAMHARVGLDIEAGGNALVRDIQGAREIVAKVKAGQDVTIEGFRLDTGRDPGK
ncbi:hypothetical protein AB4853_41335 [Bradyrhizobium sp. 1050_B9_N1_2]|uniref:hypothetical protein n=1 Tax=Bradyrhizobium sp. 1050_B9_N1_2 TaxID=3238688 RepID=UPI003EDC94BB